MEENKQTAPGAWPRLLSGAVLKWIAAITMLIDHTAAMVYLTWIPRVWRAMGHDTFFILREHKLYWVLRGVGRLAFPIYCLLLVEGFAHTRNIKKYLGRLLLFGLISELPFDQALFGQFTWLYQNVYFTLFLGLLGVWGVAFIAGEDFFLQTKSEQLLRLLGCAAVAAGAMAAAELLHTDYGWTGVAVILLFYLFRRRPLLRDTAGGLALLGAGTIEMWGWFSLLLFHFYNGERGRQPKTFFYAFYPGHLALLWLIRYLAIGS